MRCDRRYSTPLRLLPRYARSLAILLAVRLVYRVSGIALNGLATGAMRLAENYVLLDDGGRHLAVIAAAAASFAASAAAASTAAAAFTITLPLHRHPSPLTAHRSPLTAHYSPLTFHPHVYSLQHLLVELISGNRGSSALRPLWKPNEIVLHRKS